MSTAENLIGLGIGAGVAMYAIDRLTPQDRRRSSSRTKAKTKPKARKPEKKAVYAVKAKTRKVKAVRRRRKHTGDMVAIW